MVNGKTIIMAKIELVFKDPGVAIKLTKEEAISLGISPTETHQGGELVTRGAWSFPVSFTALCCSATYTKVMYTKCTEKRFYGLRKMGKVKQGGYELNGIVSVKGKLYSAFTSSQMFQIDGKLINVAVIHARIK